MLPNPGTYRAKQNGTVIVRQEESGSLLAYIPYMLLNCQEVANYSNTHQLTLGAKDGTPQTKNIQTLKTIFPDWDMENLADIEMPGEGEEAPQFDLADCHHDDSYTPEGADAPLIQFKAKWLNVIGGGRKQPMTPDERKAALAKWKTKLKALGTTKPAASAAKPAQAAAAKPAAKPAVGGPPARKNVAAVSRTSTLEEVYAWIEANNPDADDDAKAQIYYDAIDAVVPQGSSDPSKLTPTNWGTIATNLESAAA